MTTSSGGPEADIAAAQLRHEIERLANEMFSGNGPAPAPYAANVGAGGLSPQSQVPVTVHDVPLATAVGTTPPALSPSQELSGVGQGTPYFLDLGGAPAAPMPPPSSGLTSPHVVAGAPSHVPTPGIGFPQPKGAPEIGTAGLPAGGADAGFGGRLPEGASTPYFLDVAGGPFAPTTPPSSILGGGSTPTPTMVTSTPGLAPGAVASPSSGHGGAFPNAGGMSPGAGASPLGVGMSPPGGSIPQDGPPTTKPGASGLTTSPQAVPLAVDSPASAARGTSAVPATSGTGGRSVSAPSPSPSPSPSAGEASLPPPFAYEFQPELVPDLKVAAGIFDPHAVKRDFPILEERVNGRPLVWLDNAATTQKPRAVIDRISFYYEHENSNVHRAAHTLAARATDAYEGARQQVRRFLNASTTEEIVFVRGATEGINLIAKSWGARNIEPGDEILITWLEHHANIVPWQQLCSEKGAKLRVAPVDDTGQIILEEYERLLGSRTKIVALPQVSNALGTITPAKEMVDMAHRRGARVLVDGAQAVSHIPVDVQLLDCDFYVFSGHKIFAPTGIGVVYGKRDLLAAMPPWQGGGNMIADVTFAKTTYQPPPARFEAGTGSIADAVGLGAALEYLSGLGLPNVARHEHELRVYAEGCLAQIPGLTIIGTAPEKAGVISFVLDGVRTEDVGGLLDLEGIAVRSGHHCAQPILRRFGLESTVRASLAPYNTREDIDALVAAVRRLQLGRPAGLRRGAAS